MNERAETTPKTEDKRTTAPPTRLRADVTPTLELKVQWATITAPNIYKNRNEVKINIKCKILNFKDINLFNYFTTLRQTINIKFKYKNVS